MSTTSRQRSRSGEAKQRKRWASQRTRQSFRKIWTRQWRNCSRIIRRRQRNSLGIDRPSINSRRFHMFSFRRYVKQAVFLALAALAFLIGTVPGQTVGTVPEKNQDQVAAAQPKPSPERS